VVAGKVSSAREEILGRIRAAIESAPAPPAVEARAYRRSGALDREARVALFCERASEYSATVMRCAPAEVAGRIGEICVERGMAHLLVSALEDWNPQPVGVELLPDADLSVSELDSGAGVMTSCAVAIAETGTVVLDGGPGQGRRALTLVPDVHLCVVHVERIVELVPEAVARLTRSAREGRALTFISGPSATADIEFDRVEGVHGPRDLVLLVVDEAQP
jgi:L-lactate dehydrogenase complex protein LldG